MPLCNVSRDRHSHTVHPHQFLSVSNCSQVSLFRFVISVLVQTTSTSSPLQDFLYQNHVSLLLLPALPDSLHPLCHLMPFQFTAPPYLIYMEPHSNKNVKILTPELYLMPEQRFSGLQRSRENTVDRKEDRNKEKPTEIGLS